MPAKFLTPLRMEKIGPQLWRLWEPFIFESEFYPGKFMAPEGFETNLASIPRILWVIFPPVDEYDPGAVVHDAGYNNALIQPMTGEKIFTTKAVADNLFYECLLALQINKLKAKLMYKAVDAFGSPVGHK